MKPKNRVYCLDAQRSKMLFDTEKAAKTFIKFNGEQITDNPEKLRVYYCDTCGGYHISSHAYKSIYGQRTQDLVKQYNNIKNFKSLQQTKALLELKSLLRLHGNSLRFKNPKFKIKIRELIYNPQTDDILVIYGSSFDTKNSKIEDVLKADNGQYKNLLFMVKQEIGQNEIYKYMDKKQLYENIMTSVAKEVKKALNEARAGDGWNLEDCDILDEAISKIEELAYEIRNCVRGAYTSCYTYVDLAEHMRNLSDSLSEAADYIEEIEEPEDEEDEEIEDTDFEDNE